jgi:hypothetical protein
MTRTKRIVLIRFAAAVERSLNSPGSFRDIDENIVRVGDPAFRVNAVRPGNHLIRKPLVAEALSNQLDLIDVKSDMIKTRGLGVLRSAFDDVDEDFSIRKHDVVRMIFGPAELLHPENV